MGTYDLGTALSLAGSALAVAVVLTGGHGRSDGSEGGDGSEDGLELHFEVWRVWVAEELKWLERVVEEWSGVEWMSGLMMERRRRTTPFGLFFIPFEGRGMSSYSALDGVAVSLEERSTRRRVSD